MGCVASQDQCCTQNNVNYRPPENLRMQRIRQSQYAKKATGNMEIGRDPIGGHYIQPEDEENQD